MDVLSLIGALTTTGVLSVAAAQFLTTRLLDHRLAKDLKDYDAHISERIASYQSALDDRVNAAKAEHEARLKREVEEYLGERSAERGYQAEARKRLHLAVGPLRFQLLVAAAELANRVNRIGDGKYSYDMSIGGYFGQSTAYRLLRVLAVSELVERQVAIADFAVDPSMRTLLKFKREAMLCLSSHRVSLGHPGENWVRQEQHLFYDVLAIVASALVVHDDTAGVARVLRFDEFSALASDPVRAQSIAPILRVIDGFAPTRKPILWLRLLALLCAGLIEMQGADLGLEVEATDLRAAIALADDAHINVHLNKYCDALQGFRRALAAPGTSVPHANAGPAALRA